MATRQAGAGARAQAHRLFLQVLAGRVPGRDVLAWRKGARGEEQVGRILAPLRGLGYAVLHDLGMGRGNIDHVVVGPTGVFVVETKAWRGRVYLERGRRLMCSGFDQSAAVGQAIAEAVEVRKRLRAAGLACWVEAVIALPSTRLHRGPMRLGSVSVLNADDLRRHVISRPKILGAEQVQQAPTPSRSRPWRRPSNPPHRRVGCVSPTRESPELRQAPTTPSP